MAYNDFLFSQIVMRGFSLFESFYRWSMGGGKEGEALKRIANDNGATFFWGHPC